MYQFWRGVCVQQEVAKLGQTAVEFPPKQKGLNPDLLAIDLSSGKE
jgi:hypothetical protein